MGWDAEGLIEAFDRKILIGIGVDVGIRGAQQGAATGAKFGCHLDPSGDASGAIKIAGTATENIRWRANDTEAGIKLRNAGNAGVEPGATESDFVVPEVLIDARVDGIVAVWREARVAVRGEQNGIEARVVGEAGTEAFVETGSPVGIADVRA